MSEADREQLIERFVTVTGQSKYLAEQYLDRNNDDLMNAIEDFYGSNGGTETDVQQREPPKTSGRGVRTFRDLNQQDEEDDNTNNNFFTGGEKSGLQVEDPNKDDDKPKRSLIDDIFQRAREQMEQPDDRMSAQEEQKPPSGPKFSGTGFKLGDGQGASEQIADPSANRVERPMKVNREITFWRQGFTVGEGPLHRYDDPRNETVLQELNRGRVPISLLDVEFGQDVDVSVIRKTEEDYTPPKKKAGGFTGSGHRLGSPVPGETIGEPKPTSEPQSESKPETNTTPPSDIGEGDSLVQIRFANGKRASYKFNSSDSISTVYEFVRNHENSDPSRVFILSHAFPVKPIEDSTSISVADAKLKNAVIVQRWA